MINMKNLLVLVLLFSLPFVAVEASEKKSLELPGIKVIPIQDSESERQYELYIKLPEDYSKNSDKTYPVIYFTDAMWHVEILSASAEYIMEDAILVGISWQIDIAEDLRKEVGAHVSRFRDYTVTKSNNPEHQAKYKIGQASRHLAFIRNDVIKHVENHYRADPDERSYFGYSLGGLFGAYVLLAKPDTFKNYILGSPELSGDIAYLSELESNATLKNKGRNANVFVSYGASEKELGEHAEKFIAMLKNTNDESLTLQQVVIEGSYQTAFPMTGVRGVTWLSNLTKDEE